MEPWLDYLKEFSLTGAELRDGNEPLVGDGGGSGGDAIVLVHGLSDSPWFMRAIAARFEARGWDVYLPLLDKHGLREPDGMRGVSLEAWKRNTRYAVDCARQRGRRVSIGGLSTGGALAAFSALQPDTVIDGGLFLFSAALDLEGHVGPVDFGHLKAWLMTTPMARMGAAAQNRMDRFELIGRNPYRYSHVDLDGAIELCRLLSEIDALRRTRRENGGCEQPVFAAHSERDRSASESSVRAFMERCAPERSEYFFLPRDRKVFHAEVVLEESVVVGDEILEKRNPWFDEMMTRALAFADEALPARPGGR